MMLLRTRDFGEEMLFWNNSNKIINDKYFYVNTQQHCREFLKNKQSTDII